MTQPDIAIVGGGLLGRLLAWRASTGGQRVALYDAATQVREDSAAWAGDLRPYCSFAYSALASFRKLDDKEAWSKEFWHSKTTGLFAGLDELYEVWGKLSEIGSHANITPICERVKIVDVDGSLEMRLNYTGLEEKPWGMGIFDMLLIDFKMEETLFKDYQTRLQFDEKLLTMRREFEVYKERLRRALTTRYGIKPPEAPLIVLK